MRTEETVRRVFADLERRYGASFRRNPGTALARVTAETEDPFRVLISTILSQRTRDEKTEEASARLFAKYRTPKAIANAPLADLVSRIRPVGFYRRKAAKLREVSRILLRDFGGKVPHAYDDLVSLPQVGPKTANCVLVYGFGKPAIPVDVHVAVISRRLGLAPEGASEEEVEEHLVRVVPRDLWLELNERFVRFGKEVCRTSFPRCEVCTFTSFCRWFRRNRGRPPSGPLRADRASRRRR
ncbi:MAG TPA: endonuclease III [Thermoplasmata archaeon]|nr:endonuclease III [Thermoplasmata archaeon]